MAFKKNNRGSYILGEEGNQFTLTQKEYKELNTYVKRANQRRVDVAHRYFDTMSNANVMVGIEYEGYMNLLYDKGFITEKYTTSLKQFKSKDDITSLLKELKSVTKRGYGSNRVDDIRYSMVERLKDNYGGASKTLQDKILSMDKSQLLSMYLQADKDIIQDIYGSPPVTSEELDQLIEQTSSYIDKLIGGSTANKLLENEYKKGFKNYKQRQRTKKNMKAKR